MSHSDLSDLRDEFAAQTVEMDQRGFDPLPGAHRRGRRIRLRHRVVATAAGLTLVAGLVTSLPEHAQPQPAPPVAGSPGDVTQGWPPINPPIAVGREVSLSPGVTLRFESASVVAITGPGPHTVRHALDRPADKHPYSVQWLLSAPLPNGEAHTLAAIGPNDLCPSTRLDRVRVRVALDGQVERWYPAEVHPLAFDGQVTLVYLRYPLNGFVMTARNAGPRDPHGVFLSHSVYFEPCVRG
jgi:hypothetical protein